MGAAELEPFRADLQNLGAARAEVRSEGRTIEIEGRILKGHIVVTLRDVSALRRLERDLRALERMESVGHLTASLVHDFNNLLSPIAFLSACLEADLPKGTAQEMAQDIRQGAEKAAELARQTLRGARHRTPRTDTVDVVTAVREIRPLVARVVGSEIEVQVCAIASVEAVSIDRERLEHALINLAANARDAMPAGGRLTLTVKSVTLGERVSAGGLPGRPEAKEHLFEPFFTTKEPGRGTGLGLAAVKRFVDEAGGASPSKAKRGAARPSRCTFRSSRAAAGGSCGRVARQGRPRSGYRRPTPDWLPTRTMRPPAKSTSSMSSRYGGACGVSSACSDLFVASNTKR